MADTTTDILDTDGLAEVTWEACDQQMACCLKASPQDARGRGMLLAVTRGGKALDLSADGIRLYLVWRHRQAHARGCEPMEAVDAAVGRFRVFWPAAMAADEGTAECEVVLSWGERTLSTPAFDVEVGTALVGTLAVRDGFTLFVEAIKRYETATDDSLAVAAELRAARDAGEFDGKDGADGKDGLDGKNGAAGPQGPKGDAFTYADFTSEQLAALKGPKGDKGDKGDTGAQGETGPVGPQGPRGERGPTGVAQAIDIDATVDDKVGTPAVDVGRGSASDRVRYLFSFRNLKGEPGERGPKGDPGEAGPAGATGPEGPQGPAGADGKDGTDGADGVSCTHSWDGTVLTVTSASGTSSADLRGPKGDTGEAGPAGPTGATGPQGPAGKDGADGKDGTTPDLSGYATKAWVAEQFPDLSGVSY